MIHIHWIWFVFIILAAGSLGLLIAALCAVAHDADRHIEIRHHPPGSDSERMIREGLETHEDGWGETQIPVGFTG